MDDFLNFPQFFSSIWLQSEKALKNRVAFSASLSMKENDPYLFSRGCAKIEDGSLFDISQKNLSQRFLLVQFGEGMMEGVGIKCSAKCWIWVRIFSELAPIDVSASSLCFFHRYDKPGNEKKKEGKPQPHILTIYGKCILFIAYPQIHLDSSSQNVRKC